MEPTDPLAIILARVEVKLDQLLTDSGDHEQRIRKLEERRWPLPVLSAVVSVAALIVAGAGVVH
jgi:hypothetical protein